MIGRVVLVLVALAIGSLPAAYAEPDPVSTLEVFTRPDCGHCARATTYLAELTARHPDLRIVVHDIAADRAARARLQQLVDHHHTLLAVPAFVVGDRLLVGFDAPATTGATLERWLLGDQDAAAQASGARCTADEDLADCEPAPDAVALPFVGEVHVRELGLPLFSIVLGLVDGFNPCAMWVLLFLLSLLVNLRSRRRMAMIGGTFVVVSGVAYYAFMTAWLGMFLVVGASRWLELVLGTIAIGIGAIHVKDFIAPHHGISLSIPERAKPGIYARVRRIVYAESFAAALATTIVLAVMVNLVELLCTAGLPALFTQILAAHDLAWWEYHGYMALYILAYMLDDSAMLVLAVITLSRRKVQERAGRVLKLVSGAVMIGLGVLLLLQPGWLRFA